MPQKENHMGFFNLFTSLFYAFTTWLQIQDVAALLQSWFGPAVLP